AHLSQAGEAEVRMLAVDQAARGLGLASRLMAVCETLARDEGLIAVILCTETGMHAAQRLYERRGYLRQPARDRQIRDVRLTASRLTLYPPMTAPPPSGMRSRPNPTSSPGPPAASNPPAAMNVVSAGNRRGSVSWPSIRGYEAIHSSWPSPDAATAAAM